MKDLTLALAAVFGVAVSSCAGAHKQAVEPASSTGPSDTETASLPSEGEPSGKQSLASEMAPAPEGSAEESLPAASKAASAPRAAASVAPPNRESTEPAAGASEVSVKSKQHDEVGTGSCRESSSGLVLSVDRKTVSLEEGRLQAKMDGPICSLVMRIVLKDGRPNVEKAFSYTGPEREMRWNPVPRDQIEKVEIRIESKDGGYQSVFLVPWSVAIDHDEVQFDTNKAIIRESEVTCLNDSLIKINEVLATVEGKELGTITLFIAGHTDTQGSDEHNMTLSRNRAQAIAAWFMKRGLCIPIAFEGFGETALKKLTADNVDEQANRRVDYILAVEPPTIRKGATPAWKWISKGC